MRWAPPPRWPAAMFKALRGGGLGIAAMAYIGVDYLRHLSPSWHERLQPALWTVLALVAVVRVPFYKHWSAELRSALPFVAAMLFMLSALLFEALSVRFVSAVLGLDWHRNTPPLPDTGQWLLLALNEKLPHTLVEILRAHIIGLHHFLMLFMMLAFSVLFDSVKAPGLGLGARYMFTMAIGRLLRAITFVSTILPSARPWCASARYSISAHPHRWAQKYYVPYASNAAAIRQLIHLDMAYGESKNATTWPNMLRSNRAVHIRHTYAQFIVWNCYPRLSFKPISEKVAEYVDDPRPDWGSMSFLIDFLRPNAYEGASWYNLLKLAGGGCNDLLYSGHMLVAVLTAMAWTEAYGGFSSALIWLLVIHSAQREVRERHHYSVDCFVAIYVGILLWKMTGFIWPMKSARNRRLEKLEKIQSRLIQAAKDSDMEEVRELLKEVELGSQENHNSKSKGMWLFMGVTIFSTLTIVLLAFILTSDG